MTERITYRATATRDGRWWYIQIPDLETSGQARSVGRVEEAARDVIAVWLDVDPESFDIDLTFEIPAGAREVWEEAKARHAAARGEETAAAALARTAVRRLVSDGLSYREAGLVLGVSRQRAYQLAGGREKAGA